jgi:outer membrane immunogenic protein
MRRIGVMTAAASALLGAGTASAADIYTGAPGGGFKDEPVYAVNGWSGFYFGTNGGGAWTSHNGSLDLTATAFIFSNSASAKVSPSGAFGGGQIGYNWQRGGLVLGVEADFDFSSVYDKPSAGASASSGLLKAMAKAIASAAAKSELEDFGTVRGRAGYSFGSLLVYGTGGFAYGSVRDRLSVSDVDLGTTASESVSRDATATGWAAGGGFQYAFTPAVSWKAEYLHLDLGSTSLSQAATANNNPSHLSSAAASLTVHHDYDIVRTGLNYRLGSNEPLAVADAFSGLFEGGGGLKDAPVYPVSWAGFYGGINSGAAWSEHEGTLTASANAPGLVISNAKESPSGPLGGAQLGYNWQFGRFVLGVEADADAAAVQYKAFVSANAPNFSTSQAAAKSELDYFGTLRARAGYSFGRFLVYGSGGFAFGGVRDRLSLTNVNGASFGNATATASGNSNETATGWTAGAGLEVALTPQWSLKTEYLHLDLGSATLTEAANSSVPGAGASGSASLTVHHEYDIVRSGVNYHFGSYEPLK